MGQHHRQQSEVETIRLSEKPYPRLLRSRRGLQQRPVALRWYGTDSLSRLRVAKPTRRSHSERRRFLQPLHHRHQRFTRHTKGAVEFLVQLQRRKEQGVANRSGQFHLPLADRDSHRHLDCRSQEPQRPVQFRRQLFHALRNESLLRAANKGRGAGQIQVLRQATTRLQSGQEPQTDLPFRRRLRNFHRRHARRCDSVLARVAQRGVEQQKPRQLFAGTPSEDSNQSRFVRIVQQASGRRLCAQRSGGRQRQRVVDEGYRGRNNVDRHSRVLRFPQLAHSRRGASRFVALSDSRSLRQRRRELQVLSLSDPHGTQRLVVNPARRQQFLFLSRLDAQLHPLRLPETARRQRRVPRLRQVARRLRSHG